MKYAVLIDGGFIKRKLGTRTDPMTLAKVSTFLERLDAHPALTGLYLPRFAAGYASDARLR